MIHGFDTSHSRRSLPPFEQGAIPFLGPNFLLERDATNFFWDDTNNRLGLGLNSGLTARLHILEGTADILTARSGANEHFAVGQTEVTVNEGGLSTLAFRVEGDTDTALIRTFPVVNAVAIGPAVEAKLSVQGTTATQIGFSVRGAAGQTASVFESADSSGVRMFAALTTLLACNPDQSPTVDFRVSGDTTLNLLFVDASSDSVGIGDSTPNNLFTVGATSQFQVGTDGDLDQIKGVPYSWPAANAAGILQNDGAGALSWTALSGIDHGALGGLADDDHTQYARLAGRAGGQLLQGGTAAGDHLNFDPSAAANYTGSIRFNTTNTDYGSGDITGLAFWPNGFTHGGGGSGTIVSGAAFLGTVTNDANEVLTTLNMFRFSPTITNAAAVTGFIGAIGFSCSPTFNNSQSGVAGTSAILQGFQFDPTYTATGGGGATLTASVVRGFRSSPLIIGSGVTITTWRDFDAAEFTSLAGTVTTRVGYDCSFTGGGTPISFRSSGTAVQMRHAGPTVFGENATVGVDEKVRINQTSTTAAIPVLKLDQSDVDEPFIKFVGDAAAATLTRDLVPEAAVTTATRAGFVKIEVQDDGNQITDGDYYVPFYTLA